MATKRRRTQRERAEAWARDVANLDTKGRVYLFAPEGDFIRYVTGSDMARDLDGVRDAIVRALVGE